MNMPRGEMSHVLLKPKNGALHTKGTGRELESRNLPITFKPGRDEETKIESE